MTSVLTLPRGRDLTAADLGDVRTGRPTSGAWADATWEVVDGSLVVTPAHGPFPVAELDRLPDDGWRHELVDGVLVMSPSPTPRHQGVVTELALVLGGSCPADLRVFVAPLDVRLLGREDVPDEVMQPDVLVVRRADVGPDALTGIPLLAVEVLSPSTSRFDRDRKRRSYERAGITSYWLVDPAAGRLTVLELTDGAYDEVAEVDAADSWSAQRPFPITITPGDLTR